MLILCSMAFFSCKEDDTYLGEGIIPDNAYLNSFQTDTFTVTTFTIPEDSIKTDSLSLALIGAMNDPEFGTSEIGLGFQILLPEINLEFGPTPTLDSVILMLKIDPDVEGYGNLESNLDLTIHTLDEAIEGGNAYYSNYSPQLLNEIANWSGSIHPEDTVYYEENDQLVQEVGVIRIPLSFDFGNSLINAPAGTYGSNIAFLNYLNGLFIQGSASGKSIGEGGAVPIDLPHVNSKLSIYYNGGERKDLIMTTESEKFQTYTLDNRPGSLDMQLNNPNQHYTTTFVQSMGGVKTKIEIPNLIDLVKDGPVIINEARLVLRPDPASLTEDYPAPARLLLFQPDPDDGSNAFTIDLLDLFFPRSPQWAGNSNYGGVYDDAANTYTFRFNQHLQQILDDYLETGIDNNRGFYVTIPSDVPITPSRLILDNGSSPNDQKLEVKIIYTKL
jgi:hypothetical protein